MPHNHWISKPSSNDIILGRGKPFQCHPGNVRMRSILSKHKAWYMACRRERRRVYAEKLLEDLLESGMRFLRRRVIKRVVVWETVDRNVALDKVHHCLREQRTEKKMKTETDDSSALPRSNNAKTNPSNLASSLTFDDPPVMEPRGENNDGGRSQIVEQIFTPTTESIQNDLVRRLLVLLESKSSIRSPMETPPLCPSSVAPLLSTGHPPDILLGHYYYGPSSSSLAHDETFTTLDRRLSLGRSVIGEHGCLAIPSCHLPLGFFAASLLQQHQKNDGLQATLASLPLSTLLRAALSATLPNTSRRETMDAAGIIESTISHLLHARRSYNHPSVWQTQT